MEKDQHDILLKLNEIVTPRCVLRNITLVDVDDMFEYCSSENVTRYTKFSRHQSKEETKEAIKEIFIPNQLTKWGIVLRETDKLIGTIDFMTLTKDYAVLGYALSEKYWGQGIVPEAAKKLIQVGFEKLNVSVIYATHHKDNLNSGRVMQKIGMTKLGKDYYYNFKGKPFVETVKYAINRDEFYRIYQ